MTTLPDLLSPQEQQALAERLEQEPGKKASGMVIKDRGER